MSIVTRDERGTVVEGTIVDITNLGSVQIGTEEERSREGLGREDPVDLATAIAEAFAPGDRVTIVIAQV